MTKSSQQNLPPVITIDGPGGTGKGTLTHKLAEKLGWHFLDSGVLYRVLAYAAKQKLVSWDDEKNLANLAQHLELKFVSQTISGAPKILFENKDIGSEIRAEEYSSGASKVSAFAAVRTALVERQRVFRQPPGLVTDGRDMGTVIFPDAEVKIFLEASREERATRRYNQLKQQGINVSLGAILQDLEARDERDRTRAVAPLKPAADAIIIDTTHLNIEQVFEKVMAEVNRKLK